jgi:hypothetical protein
MRGTPNNPVKCTFPGGCGAPAYPKLGRCNKHRPPNSRLKYPWTEQQIADLRRLYAEHVEYRPALTRAIRSFATRHSFPPHIVKLKAGQLRLTRDIRQFWTKEELAFVREHAGQMGKHLIAKKLGRGYLSVQCMINDLGLHSRVTEGYSRHDLSLVFGVSLFVVRQWIERGWLRPAKMTDRVGEDQVRRFISAHPEEYNLKRVDQPWFKGMLFPSFGINAHDRRDRVSPSSIEEVA